ncbi:hypothetical protein C8R43DRAFT_1016503, partial [Mycena crocata]
MQLRNPFILQFPNLRAFQLRITIHLQGIQQHRDMSHPVTSHPSGFSSTSPTYSSFPLWVLLVVVHNDPVQCPGNVRTPVCVLRPDTLIYLYHFFSRFSNPSGASSFLPTISTLAHFTSRQSCTSRSGLYPPPSWLVLRTPIFQSGPDLLGLPRIFGPIMLSSITMPFRLSVKSLFHIWTSFCYLQVPCSIL